MMRNGVRVAGLAAAAAVGLLLATTVSGAVAQEAGKKAAAKTSACKGLSEAACKGQGGTCAWIAPKSGKQKPYCRTKAKSKK